MGRVYLGRDRKGTLAAIKVILEPFAGNAEFRRRFARELEAARTLSDEHLAALIEGDPLADPPWMATEYIPGPTVQERVDRDGPMAPAAATGLARDVASALAALHSHGLVHRDVKPSNVILSDDGAHLIDLGVAKAADGTQLTRTGMSPGTPSFMSPEQIRGESVGSPSDIFSLGCLVAFAATGHYPFGDGPAELVLHRVAYEEPRLDGISNPNLRELVTACLRTNPPDRPTAASLAMSTLPDDAKPPQHHDDTTRIRIPPTDEDDTRGSSKKGTSRRVAIAAGAAVTLLACGGVAVAMNHPSDTPSVLAIDPSTTATSAPVQSNSSSLSSSSAAASTSTASSPATNGSSTGVSQQLPPPGPAAPPASSAVPLPTAAVVPAAPPATSVVPSSAPPVAPSVSAAATPAPRPSSPRVNQADCYNTAIDGSFSLPSNKGPIAGGPNFTSTRCNSISLKLYSATYVTWARACLETSSGGAIVRCGSWIRLSYPNTWDLLMSNVPSGSRWQLQMYGDAAEKVRFLYTA